MKKSIETFPKVLHHQNDRNLGHRYTRPIIYSKLLGTDKGDCLIMAT